MNRKYFIIMVVFLFVYGISLATLHGIGTAECPGVRSYRELIGTDSVLTSSNSQEQEHSRPITWELDRESSTSSAPSSPIDAAPPQGEVTQFPYQEGLSTSHDNTRVILSDFLRNAPHTHSEGILLPKHFIAKSHHKEAKSVLDNYSSSNCPERENMLISDYEKNGYIRRDISFTTTNKTDLNGDLNLQETGTLERKNWMRKTIDSKKYSRTLTVPVITKQNEFLGAERTREIVFQKSKDSCSLMPEQTSHTLTETIS